MKFKWYYALLPACISFGPLLMTNMAGLIDHGWGVRMLGVLMLTIGLHGLFSLILEHRRVLNELLEQQKHSVSNK